MAINEEMCPDWEHAAMMVGLFLFMLAVGGTASVEEIETAVNNLEPHEMVNKCMVWILEITSEEEN
jgi:hypothetical protein